VASRESVVRLGLARCSGVISRPTIAREANNALGAIERRDVWLLANLWCGWGW